MPDPFNLNRFVTAQDQVLATVRQELRDGRKRTHWMWFVFPQLAGLGHSTTARYYAIPSLDHARAYMKHPLLGARLGECAELVNRVEGRSAQQIFGSPDDMKFHSSMTLFSLVQPDVPTFREALKRYFGGALDRASIDRLHLPRRAAADDLRSVMVLTEAAYAPYTALFDAPPLPITEAYAPRIARGEVWLLEGDTTLGVIVLEAHADHMLVFSIAVSPAAQGQGYGKRLLAWAEWQAEAAGLDEMRLYTNARMERNITLYLSCGYRETGRRTNPDRPGWVAVDMAKPLRPK